MKKGERFEYNGTTFFFNRNFVYFEGFEKVVKFEKSVFENIKDDIVEYSIWFELSINNKELFSDFKSAIEKISIDLNIDLGLLDYSMESIGIIDFSLREINKDEINILEFFLPIYLYIIKCLKVNYIEDEIRISYRLINEQDLFIAQASCNGKSIKIEYCILLFLEEFKMFGENDNLRFSIENFLKLEM